MKTNLKDFNQLNQTYSVHVCVCMWRVLCVYLGAYLSLNNNNHIIYYY